MNRLQESRSAFSAALHHLSPADEPRHPGVEKWSVVGHDRIVGTVYNRPGTSDGKTVVTSPVLQVRLMGPKRAPMAFTASGSAYWLGEPATSFGLDKAEQFVWRMSREERPVVDTVPALLQTQVIRVADL